MSKFKSERERTMKIVKIIVLMIVIWNIFAAGSALVLDKIDPYYSVWQQEHELTEDELFAICSDAFISESDKNLLLSILNDTAVLDKFPLEYGDMLWLPENDCSRIIGQYKEAPTDICRISVSQSGNTSSTYISVEFYETEDDKGSSPSTAYPCLCLNLQATNHSDYFYGKEVYNYSLKVPYHRIGTSSWGGPDATYHRYSCDTSPYGTPFKHQEKKLMPMKHRHLYLRYFGWFEAMMSV